MSITTEPRADTIYVPAPSSPPRWRWVHVGVAALAMVLTLPGRTHGLGFFVEPMLKSLGMDRETFGFISLWATLVGALFCLPCGWLLDRLGPRLVYALVTGALGITVVAMSQLMTAFPGLPVSPGSPMALPVIASVFAFVLLTRGLGQSALSVVSLALIGRSAGKRSGLAMGVYAFATSAGFLGAFTLLGEIRKAHPDEWQMTWGGIGAAVFVVGLLSSLLIRGHALESGAADDNPFAEASATLGQALRTPAFWTFTLACSFYGMVVAGTSQWNQTILDERGFGLPVFVNVTKLGIPVGLASNLLCGWLATRWPLHRVMAIATGLFGAALAFFPNITTEPQVYVYAAALAAAGGAITVCFFSVYRQTFGTGHLGSIQGAAQLLTVLFSAAGPMLFASSRVRFGSYDGLFWVLSALALGLAAWTFAAGLPRRPEVWSKPAAVSQDGSFYGSSRGEHP
jgi:MFS family permease